MVTWGARRAAPLLALLSLSTAFAACGPPPEAHPPPPPSASAVAPAPTAAPVVESDRAAVERIAADVRYLASPELAGRGTGEPGARAAADLVVRRFTELGLVPLGDGEGPARSYLQAFEARVGAAVAPAQVTGYPGRQRVPLDDASVTADGSADGSADGDAVFVGFGVTAQVASWDDYAGADLSGKIAVVLDGAPRAPATAKSPDKKLDALRDFGAVRYKIRTAREHKAAGVVLVAAGDELPPVPVDASGMGIPAVVVRRSAALKLLSGAKIDVDALRADPKSTKPVPLAKTRLSLVTRIGPKNAPAWNVVGALPGKGPTADQWVVVGAHYDHLGHGGSTSRAPGSTAVHPGADDNASGTAMLLEVARRLAKRPSAPPRSVAFVAFGAEEIGAVGSRHFVDHAPVPMAAVDAMINADMVGRMRDHALLVDGVGTSGGWPALVSAAATGLGLSITTGAEGFGASDHASFTAKRVPVTFLFTGVHDDYHMPSDTADKIDSAGIELVATLTARLALGVAAQRERLAFVDAPSDPHRGMRGGFKVSLGTMPDYAFQGKGMRLSGVRPDGPVARAGLVAGDVVVKVGTHDVGNVHDFMYALADLEAGRPVVVVVEREGRQVSVEVVPAPGK